MKKLFALMLSFMLLATFLVGCTPEEPAAGPDEPATPSEPQEPEGPAYKIGIMTGTVVQGEEEYRMAQDMKAKYGDMIVTSTYPAQFMTEQETTISNMVAMASDPDVKAIVMVQAVPGAAAAVDKVREIRPDMLFILGHPGEDPDLIATKGDIVLTTDAFKRGTSIIDQAHEMGANTFVHYSFARHLSYESIVKRLAIMKERCAELGMELVEADAPDPTGDAGVPGAQQFIMEDVPRKVEEYGIDTAFFSTNCSMQEPLIKQVAEYGAICSSQCCPSPYHALPAALGIEIPEDKKGDVAWLLERLDAKVVELGVENRISTWPVPVVMLFIEAGVEYAMEYIEGNTDGRFDKIKLMEIMENLAGVEITLEPWPSSVTGEPLENYLMYHSGYYTFKQR